jgi:hypothetical protein
MRELIEISVHHPRVDGPQCFSFVAPKGMTLAKALEAIRHEASNPPAMSYAKRRFEDAGEVVAVPLPTREGFIASLEDAGFIHVATGGQIHVNVRE